MQRGFRAGTIVFLVAAGLGAATAQSGSPGAADQTVGLANPAMRLELNPAQRKAILNSVRQENKQVNVPAELNPSIGREVPASMELYVLPDTALMQAPAAKGFKYTVVQNRVVLVDPTNMRVVDVIGD